jgi:hypothetical protein
VISMIIGKETEALDRHRLISINNLVEDVSHRWPASMYENGPDPRTIFVLMGDQHVMEVSF